MENITILGSTGSIGTQTLEVVEKLSNEFRVYALCCRKNIDLLKKQIVKYKPEVVCVESFEDKKALENEFRNTKVLFGSEGILELAKDKKTDILVAATSGIVAVRAVIAAIENNIKVALANKETLVMAGEIVMKKAKQFNTPIIPIDSEHSAILQCLNTFNNPYAKRLWITASGGPFLNNTREEMKNFSVTDALNHPRWSMGKKITVDCATLVNKGLEVIEAHHLYNFNYDNIKVVIHPQSIVHSFVEYIDGSFLAQMGVPSMHIPIQYALLYPKRFEGIKTNSFCPFGKTLEFLEADFEKFPLLNLTIEAGKQGGILPAILNAANEEAVYKFLNKEIKFLDIEKIVFEQIEKAQNIINPTLDEIFEADKITRQKINLIKA